jgi:hypothetical protein
VVLARCSLIYFGRHIRLARSLNSKESRKITSDIFSDLVEQYRSEIERGWRILMRGIIIEVVAALGISIISGLEIADLTDKSAAANLAAKQAEKDSSDAKVLVANIGTTNEQLSLQIEELRKTNDTLEATMLGIKNTVGDITRERFTDTNLVTTLRQFADDHKGVTVIVVSLPESEPMRAASRLVANFASGGFNVNGANLGKVYFDGVTIEFDDNNLMPVALLLLKAFTDDKEAACMMPATEKIPPNTIIISVGAKPTAAETALSIKAAQSFLRNFKPVKQGF